MGLWIARGLLAVEQGRVWAENCPDGGAQFTIVVPARGRRHRNRQPRQWHDATARILLVDDEVAIQRAVGPLLRSRATTSRSPAPARTRSEWSPSGPRI